MSDGGDGDSDGSGPGDSGHCPICAKPGARSYRPFCSKRCADIDLGRWLTNGYVIEGGNADAEEDADDTLPGDGAEGGGGSDRRARDGHA